MRTPRKRELNELVRTLKRQRIGVFTLAENIEKHDREEAAAALKLADTHLAELKEECLLTDLPLVVAYMQYRMLEAWIPKFEEAIQKLHTPIENRREVHDDVNNEDLVNLTDEERDANLAELAKRAADTVVPNPNGEKSLDNEEPVS